MKRLIKYSLLLAVFSLFMIPVNVTAQETIQVGSTTRSMIVYAPSGIEQNRPLIINMHGLNQDAAYQQSEAQWEPIADAERFVVVYPNGINNSWDLYGSSDIDFILAIIDNMYSRYGIDRNRIYLSGFSMGGMMTYYAATQIADEIAAFAPVSGYPIGGPNTNSSRPVPIIHTHGTADDVVTYSGVQNNLNAWITRNGCPTTAQVTDPYPSGNPNSVATKTYWGSCTSGTEIVLMTLEGKGHWWSMDVANGINTSQEIWNFCKNFSLGGSSGNNTHVWLEAECGNAGALWNMVPDGTSSNGTYVTIQSGNTSTGSAPTGSSAQITYPFSVSESGTYTLWGRVIAPNANDDSFWLSMDGGSWTNWNNIAPGSTSWTWDDVTTYNLSSGNHTLTVAYREDGTQLDKVYITNSGQNPSGSGSPAGNCGGGSGLVNNGIYEIEFQTDPNKVLDLRWGEDVNGGVLQPWDRNGGTAQQWIAIDAGNGYWRFRSRASSTGRVIDLENGDATNGNSIRLWDNYSNSAQTWQVVDAGGGYYRILSQVNTAKSWDVPNCNMDGSQALQLWDYYGTSCQLFRFNYIGTSSRQIAATKALSDQDLAGSFEVYPNPSNNGDFTVSFTSPGVEKYRISIFSLDGKEVFEQQDLDPGKSRVSTGLSQGVYLLKVAVKDDTFMKKIMIK